MSNHARYVMVGGFLGAGKTTALSRLARLLTDRGRRVGLICNDQSKGLVDTALLRSAGFDVEEITGGCFCCRFNSLMEAAEGLSRESAPDLFLAEPVGSCTDLVATVSYPLRRLYGDRFRVSPLSVMVDPRRAARILGLEDGPSFSEKVVYVYRKQLEEARVIVVNKTDAFEAAFIDRLVAALEAAYPRARVIRCSARDGVGLEAWLDAILAVEEDETTSLEIDYDIYAEGEALLGWCNATFAIEADALFEADRVLVDLAADLQARIGAIDGEIAHLKMTLDPLDATGLTVVSVTGGEAAPDLREALMNRLQRGELVINVRAEADPVLLEEAIRAALDSIARDGIHAREVHLEQLRPGRPVPTHRMAAAGEPS